MKTTVDLPEDQLAEAMKHAKVKTKSEAVARAVAEFNQRHRMLALTRHLGTFKDFMTSGDLKRMRAMGRHDETAYLTRNPKNAKRLLASIRSLERCGGRF